MADFLEIVKIGYYISKDIYTAKQSPERVVDCYEIELYMTSGNISYINGNQYIQERGNILIAKPGDIRYSYNEFECYYVHFNCYDDEIGLCLDNFLRVFKVIKITNLINIYEDIINSNLRQKTGYEMYTKGKLLEIISIIMQEIEYIPESDYNIYTKNIIESCRFIENNFDKHITLKMISKKANLSPTFFHTVFKSVTNKTPAKYLLDIRLSQAKNMLINTDKSLSEIALACGFTSQAYFTYVFNKAVKQTPKVYRNSKRPVL